MIAVDTSALMAIILREPCAEDCIRALEREAEILLSAGTLAEALIVAARRNVFKEMAQLIDGLDVDAVPVTASVAQRIAGAYARWGRGIHPAALNFGDCFAYDAATELSVGEDFANTDVERGLA